MTGDLTQPPINDLILTIKRRGGRESPAKKKKKKSRGAIFDALIVEDAAVCVFQTRPGTVVLARVTCPSLFFPARTDEELALKRKKRREEGEARAGTGRRR